MKKDGFIIGDGVLGDARYDDGDADSDGDAYTIDRDDDNEDDEDIDGCDNKEYRAIKHESYSLFLS